MQNDKPICSHCKERKASFTCETCKSSVCFSCAFVTVVKGVWHWYCKSSCAPYRVDAYNEVENSKRKVRSI